MNKYPHVLKYFMWAWQVHFGIACKSSAEALFNHFDRGLKPDVFLVGIADEQSAEPSFCFEPEPKDMYLAAFERLVETAEEIHANDPDRNMLYSDESVEQEMKKRRKDEAIVKAIETVLSASSANTDGYQFHCSKHVFIGGYRVYILLGLVKEVFESHTYLVETKLDGGRMRIYRSILETVIDAFLGERFKDLHMAEPGKRLGVDTRPKEDLLREAAKNFMHTVSGKGKEFMGLHGLFDSCDTLSTYQYESGQNTGHLIIARKEHPAIEMVFELKSSFEISELRKARKLLELSNERLGVVCDSYNIRGLGKLREDNGISDESVFNIHFTATHCWMVKYRGRIVLDMQYGLPQFTAEIIPFNKFSTDIKRVFTSITNQQIDNLHQLAVAVTKQRKGAMLVIIDDAAEEAERLNVQSLPIQPVTLTRESVMLLTSIDGSVLVDTGGTVHAYGVILDGIVGVKGDSSRGSRYNSAVTYLEYRGKKKPTFIIVVSEDGLVDILPVLRPKIRYADIIYNLRLLKEISQAEQPDLGAFHSLMREFNKGSFYLLKKECDEINLYRKLIEAKRSEDSVRIAYDDFVPHPEMNESFYEEEDGDINE